MSQKSFLDEVFAEEQRALASPNRFARFGLVRNPFPGNEEEFFGFIHGQDQAKQIFRQRLGQFARDRRVSALAIVADHRVGKTNFLRHYHQRLNEAFSTGMTVPQGGPRFLPFYTTVYEYDFFFVYRQVVDRLPDEVMLELGERLSRKPVSDDFPQTDLARALQKMGNDWKREQSINEDRIDLLRRWLRGGYRSLSKVERDELGVLENITNSPVGSRLLRDLMHLLHERSILDGLILFFDMPRFPLFARF